MHSNNLYLSHHGIKGQKWGVRNYQNPDGSYKKGAEGRYYHYKPKSQARTKSKGLGSYYFPTNQADHDMSWQPFDRWKYRSMDSSDYKSYENILDNTYVTSITNSILNKYKNMSVSSFVGPKFVKPEIEEHDPAFQSINDHDGRIGTTNNCLRCGVAVELLKRGLNGIKAGKSNGGMRFNAIGEYFKNAELFDNLTLDNMDDKSAKMPVGASGVINCTLSNDNGGNWHHTMHWTKTKDGVQIEDGQTGNVYHGGFGSLLKTGLKNGVKVLSSCAAYRLDESEPDIRELTDDGIVTSQANQYYWNKYTKQIVKGY